MKRRKRLVVISIVLAAWLTLAVTDFYRVTRFEKQSFDDGGSGRYRGLGYSFAIEGNFMPDDEYPGVTRYSARLFGIHLKSGIRD